MAKSVEQVRDYTEMASDLLVVVAALRAPAPLNQIWAARRVEIVAERLQNLAKGVWQQLEETYG